MSIAKHLGVRNIYSLNGTDLQKKKYVTGKAIVHLITNTLLLKYWLLEWDTTAFHGQSVRH